MSNVDDLKYTPEHEWVRVEDDIAVVGITDHAQEALGDIVYLELPEQGDTCAKGDAFGVVESVKTTSDLYAPLSGTVTDVNEDLVDNCAVVNEDCYGEGWMVKLEIKSQEELASLMSHAEYLKFLVQEEGNEGDADDL